MYLSFVNKGYNTFECFAGLDTSEYASNQALEQKDGFQLTLYYNQIRSATN